MTPDESDRFATEDGVASSQGSPEILPVAVAPDADDAVNTLRPAVAPIGCWRLNEALFDFDSSVLKVGVRASAPRFAELVQANPGAFAAVFAHADSAGSDEYNTALSGRRAQSVYALLVRDVALWEKLYREPAGGDDWGTRAVQVMLAALPLSPPYLAGEPSGARDAATIAAVRRFQAERGLAEDGVAGPDTRAALFAAYMDVVCVDATGKPFSLTASQFIGRGEDKGGKGAYQGCGEFNPVLILSRADQARYDTGAAPRSERNTRNASNRRAMVFLFPPSAAIAGAGWPCPRVGDGAAACRKMFWPDGDRRRAPGAAEREYRDDLRTMSCSWYDRFARKSPCEGRAFTRIAVALRDRAAELIEDAPYRIQAAGRTRAGRAANGMVSLTVPGLPDRCLVEWGRSGDKDVTGDAPFRLDLYVDYDRGTDEEQARKRLHNIGYPDSYPFDVALRAFQRDAQLPSTGTLDDATRSALIAAHGTLATSVPSPDEDPDG